MSIEDHWLANLRALVQREGNGDLRAGYKAVAERSRLSEEYVYQLYQGREDAEGRPRQVGKRAAKKIAAAYGKDGDTTWFDQPVTAPEAARDTVTRLVAQEAARPSLGATLERLGELLGAMDDLTRIQVAGLVQVLVNKPEEASEIARRAQAAVEAAMPPISEPGKRTG